jgi:hypothetical protein
MLILTLFLSIFLEGGFQQKELKEDGQYYSNFERNGYYPKDFRAAPKFRLLENTGVELGKVQGEDRIDFRFID